LAKIFKQMSRSKKIVAVGEFIPKDRLLESEHYPGQYDPHVWFDVSLWIEVAKVISDALVTDDPGNEAYYVERANDYVKKLEQLHQYVLQRANELPTDQRVLVTAHDAFRYFGRAYGFEVRGLQGVSTEAEAGINDVVTLAWFIADQKINAIFIESSVPERNIRAVRDAVQAKGWNVTIGGELFSDAMGDEGTVDGTYIGMVTHNIDTIVDALK
jgi:manganese/zinc/iron transport system substrate-binding protein